jgi:hypothetical protein
MLIQFLEENRNEILAEAAKDALTMAGVRPSSDQLKAGLPIFFEQLIKILKLEKLHPKVADPKVDREAIVMAAANSNEVEVAIATGYPGDVEVAKSADLPGIEFLRLGYTLSHIVHSYGALCQSITGLATTKNFGISQREFRDLNCCLSVAIASAVTEYQAFCDMHEVEREVRRCGFCAHELRNALSAASLAYQMIKSGAVGFSGSTGQILEKNLMLMEALIGRSLVEVKLGHSDVKLDAQTTNVLLVVDQILLTASVEAKARGQHFDLQISPNLCVEADRQFLHSALSNLIQNAIKYSHKGTKIEIRGKEAGYDIILEVEDECGGLAPNAETDLFKPYEQQNKNREGLGLGLNIARKAIELHGGTLAVTNLPSKGCVFTITLPKKAEEESSTW